MDTPRIVFFDGDVAGAGEALAALVNELGFMAPLVIASVHGDTVAGGLPDARHERPDADAGIGWASALGSQAHRDGSDAIVAIGGGRCLDLGKLAAARAGVPVIAVPTQLSHDGLCSPIAVAQENGVKKSLGAVPPKAVFLSLPTISEAPLVSLRAGLGDLIANPFALRDWALAENHGLTTSDRAAWEMSERAYATIEPYLDVAPQGPPFDQGFLKDLAEALILSGQAMIHAGSSRPASGGEHEISHALDELFGGRAMHGEQVAFGCVVSAALFGDDPEPLRVRLRRLGLPQHPDDLGLGVDEMVSVLLRAPDTRPGRFTIVEDAALDGSSARNLIEAIWDVR